MIICREQQKSEQLKDAFTNPVVIIEILSNSIQEYEEEINLIFTEKFVHFDITF